MKNLDADCLAFAAVAKIQRCDWSLHPGQHCTLYEVKERFKKGSELKIIRFFYGNMMMMDGVIMMMMDEVMMTHLTSSIT